MKQAPTHPFMAFLVAFALLASAFVPVVPPCASEVETPCDEEMDHGAMLGMSHDAMEIPSPPQAPPVNLPQTTVGMACCTITATMAPRIEAATAFVVLAVVAAPDRLLRTEPQPVPAPAASPPGRSIPLHIALGRFLT